MRKNKKIKKLLFTWTVQQKVMMSSKYLFPEEFTTLPPQPRTNAVQNTFEKNVRFGN